MKFCPIPDCGRPSWRRSGLCQGHEKRRKLGLPLGPIRRKEPNWKPEEVDWMVQHLSRHTYASMGRALGKRFGFPRTEWAVLVKCKRVGVRITTVDGHYSPCRLMKMLDLPDSKVISRKWMARGLRVRETKCIAGSSGFPIRLVDPADLARFLEAHPEACDLSRVPERVLRQLGLDDLPAPPPFKVLRCKRGHENVVPLFPPWRDCEHCRTCGVRMSRWAVRYSAGPPTPFRVRSRLEDMPYYDPAADLLQCLICGEWKRGLGGHVHKHGLGFREYRRRFGLPADAPMLCKRGRYNLGHNWGKHTLPHRTRRAAMPFSWAEPLQKAAGGAM